MNKAKNVIPDKIREDINEDLAYKVCMLYGHHGHECDGRLTKEHAIIVGSKKIHDKWAVISLCAKGHDVDQFQDGHNLRKDLNEWVAYSRASDADLLTICGEGLGVDPNLSKARSHFQKKAYLIGKYGVWEQKAGYKAPGIVEKFQNYKFPVNGRLETGKIGIDWAIKDESKTVKKMWYSVPEHLQEKVQEVITYHKIQGEDISIFQAIDLMIQEYAVPEKVDINYSLIGLKNK